LERSFHAAVAFNANTPLRTLMVSHGYGKSVDALTLNMQETLSLSVLVEVLYQMVPLDPIMERYHRISVLAMERLVEIKTPGAASKRRTGSKWVELSSTILRQWTGFLATNTEEMNNALMLAQRVSVAVDLCLVVEINTSTAGSAKDFIMNATISRDLSSKGMGSADVPTPQTRHEFRPRSA